MVVVAVIVKLSIWWTVPPTPPPVSTLVALRDT
jgi:hypothetical protein